MEIFVDSKYATFKNLPVYGSLIMLSILCADRIRHLIGMRKKTPAYKKNSHSLFAKLPKHRKLRVSDITSEIDQSDFSNLFNDGIKTWNPYL